MPRSTARAIQIARAVERPGLPVTDVVVGYRSVMVYVDPLADDAAASSGVCDETGGGSQPSTARRPARWSRSRSATTGRMARISATSPTFAQCSVDEVIELHLALEYRVFVVGFVPGFAYMAPVDPRIAAPRRSSPRLKVPAGSVAVAAGQTGIYPAETPGGWSLIGRCPVRPYDPDRAEPFLFHPGDRVRFHRISETAYRATTQWGDA